MFVLILLFKYAMNFWGNVNQLDRDYQRRRDLGGEAGKRLVDHKLLQEFKLIKMSF